MREKKLIVRRLVSGILNIVIGLVIFITGMFWIMNYGQSIVGNSLANVGFFGLVQGIIYVSTCKAYPRKWLEVLLGVYAAFNVLRPFFVTVTNSLFNVAIVAALIFFIYVIGAPLTKTGYSDMPYFTKEK
ncbi:hypothetical protein X291_02305 [Oenococcus oeni IOEB_C23]|uniref:hypothetical protein n=1 Tax=Oenococcus oeni TaxID=1247 RepID=UPI00050DE805|nr:hypothetical protein [Oenococcus oeni]KGH66820.1 hypothetical protein X291_02305 [Oenococcus oeni IOEB_C23]